MTPPTDIPAMMRRLRRAPKVDLLTFEGGETPRSDACEALSCHGFPGLEQVAVEAIARWMRATSGGG